MGMPSDSSTTQPAPAASARSGHYTTGGMLIDASVMGGLAFFSSLGSAGAIAASGFAVNIHPAFFFLQAIVAAGAAFFLQLAIARGLKSSGGRGWAIVILSGAVALPWALLPIAASVSL